MKKRFFSPLVLALAVGSAFANTATTSASTPASTMVQLSASVNREVEKDLMQVSLYSRKTGKSLPALKKQVAAVLNPLVEQAKKLGIEVQADGVQNYPNYNAKGKVDGWVAEGRLLFKSKNFEAVAGILENLAEEVAVGDIQFSVSPEKMATLEDELTLNALSQLQHKAEVVQKGLQAKSYHFNDVQLNMPFNEPSYPQPMMLRAAKVEAADTSMPLEAGKATLSATATANVRFEK